MEKLIKGFFVSLGLGPTPRVGGGEESRFGGTVSTAKEVEGRGVCFGYVRTV